MFNFWVTAAGDSSDGRSRKALPLVAKTIFSSLEMAGKVALRRSSGGSMAGIVLPAGQPGALGRASPLLGVPGLGMAEGLTIAPGQTSLEQAFKVMFIILDGWRNPPVVLILGESKLLK